ncbi:MAG: hypothetical protein IJL53_06010 [Firmicutes bacterium]|nr:hypothetical protein [Bacillota bacterium]
MSYVKKKLITAWTLILLGVGAFAFDVISVKNALPTEGKWKGVIFQFHPAYPQQGLVIILVGIVGAFLLIAGIIYLVVILKQDY